MSPRSTTRPLYFWCFVSNSAFFIMTEVHQWGEVYFSTFFSCFINHVRFVSDFCFVPRWNLFKFLPFFIHCCCCCGYLHCLRHRNKFVSLVIFGLLATFCSVSRRTQVRSAVNAALPTGPSASRITFSVTTITDGNARMGSRSSFVPWRWPDSTLSRLRAEEYDRPVTQSIATPEPSSRTISTLDRTLVARESLECVTTPGSRRSGPGWAAAHFTWILTVFTSLACCPGAPLTATETRLASAGIGEDCRPYHVGAARLSLLCDSLEVLPRRLVGTTAGC